MTDAEMRLRVWIRDFGVTKGPVFIADLEAVLTEVERLQSLAAMLRQTHELHLLRVAGKEDSPEADAIRDATDACWRKLSEAEKDLVRLFSECLQRATSDVQQVNALPPPDAPA